MKTRMELNEADVSAAISDYLRAQGYIIGGDAEFVEYFEPTADRGSVFVCNVDVRPTVMAAQTGVRGSKVRNCVREHLEKNSSSVFTPEMLSRIYGCSPGAVGTQLAILVKQGLVKKHARGQYQWNEAITR